jgi:adenylate cyclase
MHPDPAEKLRQLTEWLARDGRFLPDNAAILAALCEHLTAAGVPLDRAALHQRALHARYRGVSRIWRPGLPLDERLLHHSIEGTASYLESPVRACIESRRLLRWRLDNSDHLPFAILDELRADGFVEYVIAPLLYAAGPVNVMSWATRHTGGFTRADIEILEGLLPFYGTVVETKSLWRFLQNMLSTYVGEEPSRLILDGQVRRGDLRTITAALMLVDLRDFTRLTDRLAPHTVIRMLNDYFDCVFPAVRRYGGEIMEIMGDGVLAIFQDAVATEQACRAALNAAREALAAIEQRNRREPSETPPLHAGIALHYGTLSYGNIGSGDRLDFTVIGSDVNLVSRIEQFCRELDRELIMSEPFVDVLGQPMWELGSFELRGFSRLYRLFELPDGEAVAPIEPAKATASVGSIG